MSGYDYRFFFEGYLYAVLNEQEASRHLLFREWIVGGVFCCQACGREFHVTDADVNEEDEVLCAHCLKRADAHARRSS